jgi:acyl carrier protein
MNEEISRILKILEEGKITAAEAELLIRALKEGGTPPPPPPPGTPPPPHRPRPRAEICDIVSAITRAIGRAERRQRRYRIWSFLQQVRVRQEERQERRNRMSVAERVLYVFEEIVLPDVDEIKPEMRLREDLHLGAIARDNLRFGLEAEFDIRIAAGEALGWKTVQEVMDYVARVTGSVPSPPPSPDTPPESPDAPAPPATPAPTASPEPTVPPAVGDPPAPPNPPVPPMTGGMDSVSDSEKSDESSRKKSKE